MDSGILTRLKDRLSWLEARQTVVARNIANVNVPGFKAEDLAPFDPASMSSRDSSRGYETRQINAPVSLEDEMSKLGDLQLDYQLATTVYVKSLGLLKIAIGRK